MWWRSLLLALALAVAAQARDILTLSGEIYREVTVTKVQADGIRITHSTGIAFLDFASLPEALRKEFGYDPAAYAAAVKVREERDAQARAERARIAEVTIKAQADAQARIAIAREEALRRLSATPTPAPAPQWLGEKVAESATALHPEARYAERDYSAARYEPSSYSARTQYVSGYTRKDGTYVHSYYRRPARR
jgi:hypothetical protein